MAALFVAAVPMCGVPALAGPAARPAPGTSLEPRALVYAPSPGVVEESLRRRLEREARRQRLGLDPAIIPGPAGEDAQPDPDGSERRVQRAFVRALRGALDEQIEGAARDSAFFAPLFRFIDRRDSGLAAAPAIREPAALLDSASPFAAAVPYPASASPAPTQRGPADVALSLRLDAHPRFVLGTRFGPFIGRVEMPLLERAPRLSLDRPVGGHGWASLQAGRSEERGGWADLALQFRF